MVDIDGRSGATIAAGALCLLYAATWLLWPFPQTFEAARIIEGGGLALSLIALSVIDLRSYRLPNALTFPLIAAGIVLLEPHSMSGIALRAAAAAVGFLVFYGIAVGYRGLRGVDGLGLGDAKLLAAGGAWTGLTALPFIVLIASVSALGMAGLAYLRGTYIHGQTHIPFGPFLAFGIWIGWLGSPVF